MQFLISMEYAFTRRTAGSSARIQHFQSNEETATPGSDYDLDNTKV